MSKIILRPVFWLLPVAGWSAIALASLLWSLAELDRHNYELAVNRAEFVFRMVEAVRLWNARHGGVYALVDEATPPNPYLEVEERDLRSPSGKLLTLVNPAYMTRQISELLLERGDTVVHLTSLKPLNPRNQPDPWEAEALRGFEQGLPSQARFVGEGERQVFRFAAPLRTEKACLACHAHQGYREGDIRGGVSVSFPAAPLLVMHHEHRDTVLLVHLLAWLALSSLTLFMLSRLRGQLLSLRAINEQQDRTVDQRTWELRHEAFEREAAEARLRLLVDSSGEGIYGVDGEGRFTFCNPIALRLLGYHNAAEILGKNVHQVIHHSRHDHSPYSEEQCPLVETYRHGVAVHGEDDVFWRADRTAFPVEFRSHPIYSKDRLVGAVVTFSDISRRKSIETRLRTLSKAVEQSPASAVITNADGSIEYVNHKFEEVTGYAAEEVIGRNPRVLQSGRTPQETYQELWRKIAAGQVWQGEFLNRKKSGDLYWEKASISPIKDSHGRITHYVAIKEDVTERKEMEQKIWHQANFDPLTGLPNRNLFYDRLQRAIVQANRECHLVGLLYIDLDHFKEVNDTLGHEAGDQLLREVAQRLAGCVRESDTVARMGGDEFTVILSRIDSAESAAVVAEKIREQIARPFVLQEQEARVSASIGIAIYPETSSSISELIRLADQAMYRAKESGRDAFRFVNDRELRG